MFENEIEGNARMLFQKFSEKMKKWEEEKLEKALKWYEIPDDTPMKDMPKLEELKIEPDFDFPETLWD